MSVLVLLVLLVLVLQYYRKVLHCSAHCVEESDISPKEQKTVKYDELMCCGLKSMKRKENSQTDMSSP